MYPYLGYSNGNGNGASPSRAGSAPSSQYGAPTNGNGNSRNGNSNGTIIYRVARLGFTINLCLGYSNGNGNGASSNGRVGSTPSSQYGAPTNGNSNGNGFSSNDRSGSAPSSQYGAPSASSFSGNGQQSSFSSNSRTGPGSSSSGSSASFGSRNNNGNSRPQFALADPLTDYQPQSNSFGTDLSAPSFSAPSSEYGAPLSGDSLDRSYLPPSK